MRRRLLLGGVVLTAAALGLVATLVRGPGPETANAASHREAPLISLDPAADITDFFMFRSYEPGQSNKVVLIMNTQPGEEPSSGPNYFNFDPSVKYAFGIDNNGDGKSDISIDFQFRNEIRGVVDGLGLPLSYVGNVPPGSGSVIPPITRLDGKGSEGLGLRQRYQVSMTGGDSLGDTKTIARDLIAVPSDVGPNTMPNYASLRNQGIYNLGNGVRVFAGQAEDPFYIDLGGVFDTLNFRRFPPLLSNAEDANDNINPFGVDMLSGFNVQTIAIELPISMLTGAFQTLGGYAYTSRPNVSIRSHWHHSHGDGYANKPWVQVQRLANPLINEVIIGTKDKDYWNSVNPWDEGKFLDYYLNPRLALALQLVFGAPAALNNRTDLVNALLKYGPGDPHYSDLLRLDTTVAPVPLAQQKRLTVLAGDNAGWPNGRRPRDDVTDIAVRLVGGPTYIALKAGDGVNKDDAPLSTSFPFLSLPSDGRNRSFPHINP
jgi:hypothetical protein